MSASTSPALTAAPPAHACVHDTREREPFAAHAVQEAMKLFLLVLAAIAFGLSGCASAPEPVSTQRINQPIPPWPESVAETCPKRRVPLECLHGHGVSKRGVNQAFEALVEQLHGCIRPESLPVKVDLRIETRGGVPMCVDRSVRDNATARCAATVVARGLRVSGGSPTETCSFTYPLRFEMSDDEDEAP